MAETHPDAKILERFMRNELSPSERRGVVRHLVAGCPQCLGITRRLWSFGQRPAAAATPGAAGAGAPARYREMLDRLVGSGRQRQQRIAAERNAVPRLWAELERQPRAQRLGRVCGEARYRSVPFCELLIEKSRDAGADDPALAVELAELAVAVAERLDPRRCGAILAESLKGRSWAWLGNARRLAADLAGAERALALAELLLEPGAGDALERAELLDLMAGLRADQKKFAEAEHCLDRALAAYRAAGEEHFMGRTLIRKGMLRNLAGQGAAGVEPLRQGLSLIDPGKDGPLVASALYELASLLVESGRAEEASQPVRELRGLYERSGDRVGLVRLRRLEGKIEEALGRPEAAEAAMLEARDRFLEEGLGLEAALVSLELAVLFARQGRAPEMLRLSQSMAAVYRAKDMRREIVAALIVFQRLAESDPGNVAFLTEMVRYLGGSPRMRPWLR